MAFTSSSTSSDQKYSPAASSLSWKYNVFLSFRGEDTRKTFVDHLYSALVQRLIHTYKDDTKLVQGDSISPSLMKAIRESQIAVIIFSKYYADSSWCLDELSYIMQCRDEIGLIVMPVFYDVDPSEVRNQKMKFGQAFAKQVDANNITKVELWRKALVDASNITGWETRNIAGGYESKVIKEIVDTIFYRLLSSSNSDADEELVGMRVRLPDLISSLEIGSGCVRMIGIWGIGGSGKTTLAFSVYTKISRHFQGHCFIANIREQSKHGLETLQQRIISTLLKTQIGVQSVEEGKHIIKSRLCNSKLLVVLDDVDCLGQLEALAGSYKWFGEGSRIIITTRDEHLLRTHRVDHIYPVRLLSKEESIQLFYKHAYNEKDPLTDYETLSSHVVSYAAGLPIALKVLGSFLFDKNKNEWRSALVKLKDIPNIEVMDILRISYDGLETLNKELFLDIACFFRHKRIDDAMEILDACGFHPVIGIKVLRQKALITISNGKFDMHDLVQEMGHYIVRAEHPNNPEKHSRVWLKEEIRNICSGDSTTENHKIEALAYDGHLSQLCKIISNMKKLRWLIMYDYKYAEGPTFLSNELRYFHWVRYPAIPFPDSFQPLKLVVMILQNNLQKQLWNGYKYLPQLKVLQLWNMWNLLSTPDFHGLPCLQKLELDHCEELETIHFSLGNHRSLEYVRVFHCRKLQKFPMIVKMEKLNTLDIKDCENLIEFPNIQSNMKSLVKLSLNTYFCPSPYAERGRQLETIFRHLTCSLRILHLRGWGLKDGEIPSDIRELSNLEVLDLSHNAFSRLGFSLSQLTRLKMIRLKECKRLVELPELPSSLAILTADGCVSLTTIGNGHTNFKWLCQVSLMRGGIVNDARRLLQSMILAIENQCMILHRLEGVEIPRRFLPRLVRGRTCILQLPTNWCNDFCGFLMCAVSPYASGRVKITMEQVIQMDIGYDGVAWEESSDDKTTWVGFVSFASLRHTLWWDETYNALSFSFDKFGPFRPCSGFGFVLVPTKIETVQTETSTDFCHYKPTLKIIHDSISALDILLSTYANCGI